MSSLRCIFATISSIFLVSLAYNKHQSAEATVFYVMFMTLHKKLSLQKLTVLSQYFRPGRHRVILSITFFPERLSFRFGITLRIWSQCFRSYIFIRYIQWIIDCTCTSRVLCFRNKASTGRTAMNLVSMILDFCHINTIMLMNAL